MMLDSRGSCVLASATAIVPNETPSGALAVADAKTQEPLESSIIVEPVAIVSQMTFSIPLYLLS